MTFDEEAKCFDESRETRTKIEQAIVQLEGVRKRYPLRANPEFIDRLTPKMLFSPPNKPDYFFYWVEHGLKNLGAIGVGSTAPWLNASRNIDQLKELLHSAMDEDLSIAQKIDLGWDNIKHWGGDRLIAKKIISMYFDDFLPIFKANHLERIHDKVVGRDYRPSGYRSLSRGEKYQVLMKPLIDRKNKNETTRSWSNPYFMRFLYESFSPWYERVEQEPVPIEKLRPYGLIAAPDIEQEVVFLFAKLHVKMGYPNIARIQTEFPDVQAMDVKRNTVKIELEVRASNFLEHDHPPGGCDVVVCWEDDIGESWPHPKVKVLQLRDYL